MNFVSLNVADVVMHTIPRKLKGGDTAEDFVLSEGICELQEGVREEIQARLRGELDKMAREVIWDDATDSKVPQVIKDSLAGDGADLVSVSQRLAQDLLTVQSARNSPGILVVAQCTFNGSSALLIVKFEHERGMRAEQSEREGQNVYGMELLKNLFLTTKSRVFKIGLFVRPKMPNAELTAWAVDKQSSTGRVASYFLEDFLGCKYVEDSKELTKRFFEKSWEWINSRVTNPTARTNYGVALMAEMSSNRSNVTIDAFARAHLEIRHDADDFRSHLQACNLPNEFAKDDELINKRIEKMQVKFESGAVVHFPLSALQEESVVITEVDEDRIQITLVGEITDTSAKSLMGAVNKPE